MSKLMYVLIGIAVLLVIFIAGSLIAKFSFNQNVENEMKNFLQK